MNPYKLGGILTVLLMVVTIPMLLFSEEMAILIPINILVIGLPILIAYFLLVFIYQKFSRRIFITALLSISI